MAIADYFTKANNGVDAVPTTLTSTLTPSGTTATINSATGWPVDATDGPVHFTCFKAGVDGKVTAGTQTFYKATLTGTTLSNITRTGGSSVTTFENGDPAIVYFTPAWANDIVAGIKVAHNQDGTLKTNAVTTASIANKAVTLPKINGGSTAGVLVTDASGNVAVGAKTTDANGWTVYDYGGWKEYTKSGTTTLSVPANGWARTTTTTLPSGTTSADIVGCRISSSYVEVATFLIEPTDIGCHSKYGSVLNNTVKWSFFVRK